MKKSIALLSAIGLMSLSVAAFAAPIIGTSTGSLANGVGSTVTVTQLQPYQVSWYAPNDPTHTAILTAGSAGGVDTINQNYATLGGNGVKLASLNWANLDNAKDQTVNLNWNVLVNLTDPNQPETFSTNSLSVNLQNGGGTDTINLDSLSALTWTFGTWVVSNFRYVEEGAGGAVSGLDWTSTKSDSSTLWIEADFKNSDTCPAPVPEPGTMMLLGAGFLGLAVYGKRRRNA